MNVCKAFDPSPELLVHGIEINQEQTAFVAACEDGFRVYDTVDCRLRCFREFHGSLQFATILSRSNILALLGGIHDTATECPSGRIVLWDNARNAYAVKISDGDRRPIRILLNNAYFVPIYENGAAIFQLASRIADYTSDPDILLQSYQSASNQHAVGALGSRFLAIPGISKGKVALIHLASMKSSIINAHGSTLRALALSGDERLLATASEKGTIIRVFSTQNQSRITELRRGLDEAAVFSLSFSPDSTLLALTSDKGTLHIFNLAQNEPEPRVTEEQQRQSFDYTMIQPEVSGAPSQSNLSLNNRTPTHISRPSSKRSPLVQYREEMSESTILMPLDSTDPDLDMSNWQNVAQAASSQTKPVGSKDQRPPVIMSADTISDHASMSTFKNSHISAASATTNKSKKYGNLANLAWMPKVLRDDYSVCKIDFTLPGGLFNLSTLDDDTYPESSLTIPPPAVAFSTSSAHRRMPSAPQGQGLTHRLARPTSMAQGAPPKGLIAWINEFELVVVSAGRGSRWEKFQVQRAKSDGRTWHLRFVGWKAYLDEEGR